MKEIQLTKGKVALVDDEDYEHLNKFKWHALDSKHTFYADRRITINGKRVHISMHRFLLDAGTGDMVDHKDRNGLNNQRHNLRFCTCSQNNVNRSASGISKYRGVSLKTKKAISKSGELKFYTYWSAAIQVNGKVKHLGYFKKEDVAAIAYNNAAIKQYGEFANLNIVSSDNTKIAI